MDEQLKVAKETFLDRYNPHRTEEAAASDAVKSASQHNSLYATTVSEQEKGRVCEAWKTRLGEFASRYKLPMSASQEEAYKTYEADFRQTRSHLTG